jgi:peptidoglycan/xylan/chitin deacetylase (PgdA/CDA1 family)
MPAVVLTYHSHHVVGPDYAQNDHVALASDLLQITEAGWRIVGLDAIVGTLAPRSPGADGRGTTEKRVALTFDDGPRYDAHDFTHPEFGLQKGFLNLLREFRERHGAAAQPGLSATSFVIASPEARRVIAATYDAQYTYMEPGSMDDAWWEPAIDTGLIAIANHSWDHLHPGLPRVAHSRDVRADFGAVLSVEDADAQIARAAEYIAVRTRGRATPYFAYPFGQSNAFLVDDYLPARGAPRVRAAFGVEPRAVDPGEGPWCLPRFVCGHHWRTPAELAAILAA